MRFATFRTQAAEGAHVVQTVRQFDDDDADVVHHRQQHLAITLRLPVFGREEVDLAEFGDAVNAAGYLFTEVLLNIGSGDGSVLHDVVQEARLDADDVHAHAGENHRDGKGMTHVGLARDAHLSGVILGREIQALWIGVDRLWDALP